MNRVELILVFVGIFGFYSSLVAGQCDQRDRGGALTCCRGRNSTCAVERYDADQPGDGRPKRKVCFCDAFCEPAGDCCPDFARVKEECDIQGKSLTLVLSFLFLKSKHTSKYTKYLKLFY